MAGRHSMKLGCCCWLHFREGPARLSSLFIHRPPHLLHPWAGACPGVHRVGHAQVLAEWGISRCPQSGTRPVSAEWDSPRCSQSGTCPCVHRVGHAQCLQSGTHPCVCRVGHTWVPTEWDMPRCMGVSAPSFRFRLAALPETRKRLANVLRKKRHSGRTLSTEC